MASIKQNTDNSLENGLVYIQEKQGIQPEQAAASHDHIPIQAPVSEISNTTKPSPGNQRIVKPPLPIRQIGFRAHNRLPDFRNLGVCLRILIIINLVVILAAILQAPTLPSAITRLAEISAYTQPVLLLSFLLLLASAPRLLKLPYRRAIVLILVMEISLSWLLLQIGYVLLPDMDYPTPARALLLTGLITAFILYYFNLRHRALSPAIAEARLQALQARIRPHFLFNSINAVLSLIRSQPKRAETALEDMAELFRVLMADNRELVPLASEIALCRQYLALEKLRLEERLQIHWQIDSMPADALIPPLLLQPLLENAVYHGIEPMAEGGTIDINIYSVRKEVHVLLGNPFSAQGGHHSGNKMALTNIRERLALHFDAEATLTSKLVGNRYEVHITIPYQPHRIK